MNPRHAAYTVSGIDAPRLRLGLAVRSQSASDLLVRVAGAVLGPAFGPAALSPASVLCAFTGSFKLWEPGTRGLGSRRQRVPESTDGERRWTWFATDEEVS
jgi:hypothetical protein